ncbi:hypothetical protein [Paraburkholderia tropica]|uniref:hypothetical protein n=1 Tax=Paraburkholderia tropica TaxID=92647 RepID=UPI003D2DCA9F
MQATVAHPGQQGEAFVTLLFGGNRTVTANAILDQSRNQIIGRRLADQGGRFYTAHLETRYRPMGVVSQVSE